MIFIAYNLLGARPEQLAYGHIWASVYQSFSRGRLRITSRDPEAGPEIRLQMLSDPRDLNRMRDAMRRLIEIANHPALRAIASAAGLGRDGQTPAGTSAAPPSDEWMLEHCFDVQHAAGTCRMGAPSDERSVVDPRCCVLGVEGLRVIDASIIPEMIRANTHLTCVMIGEHMAAQIRAGG
jgi:choline dehydrogenase